MGTWDAGPFENDAAMDYLGDVARGLEATINEFVAEPRVDDTLDPAFAALAILNILAEKTSVSLPEANIVRGWRDAFLRCYDAQIDGLDPEPTFKEKQRDALRRELDRLVIASETFHRSVG